MSPARAASAALVLVATAVAAPALAQVGARTLVVYPVAAAGATGADANDVSLLLDAALHRVVQRSEEVVLAEPLVTRATCGPAPSAPPQCLAGLSGGGLALRVTVHRSQSTIVVQLEAVDAKARSFGPVTVSVDAFAQSAEPLVHGILMLVEQVAAASRKPDLRTIPLPPPPVLAKPAPPPAAPRAWMRTAGPWLTGTGAALLAGGVALTAMNRSLSNELERKFSAGTLTSADLASYRRVEQYDKVSEMLFAAGGAFTLSGIAIWTSAPERGRAAAGVAGRF